MDKNRRWVVEYESKIGDYKYVFKEHVKEESQVLEEIARNAKEIPKSLKLVKYYLGYYDPEEDDYVESIM